MKVELLEKEVIAWAENKGIPLVQSNAIKQMNKSQEELNELRDEINNEINMGSANAIKLELGDVLVTLCLQAAIWSTSLEECLELALNKISKRTGKIVDGVFIKD
jgi:NTP pyrophosphatase (non-canonical NTP hydrolase)